MKSLSETIGTRYLRVRKALRKLEDAKTVTVEEEKRVRLHDGGYQAESRRYLVAHPCGDARGARMRVTMRELMLDFDRCYHEAIRTLIPQPAARQHLSAAEWQEHMSWQEGGGCIDQDSAGRTLHHPDFGELIVYEQGGRILYPACECAKKLGLANPRRRREPLPRQGALADQSCAAKAPPWDGVISNAWQKPHSCGRCKAVGLHVERRAPQ